MLRQREVVIGRNFGAVPSTRKSAVSSSEKFLTNYRAPTKRLDGVSPHQIRITSRIRIKSFHEMGLGRRFCRIRSTTLFRRTFERSGVSSRPVRTDNLQSLHQFLTTYG